MTAAGSRDDSRYAVEPPHEFGLHVFLLIGARYVSSLPGLFFWIRLSSELRQINEVPSVACERWIASDSSQISTSVGDRFEITPSPLRGIISPSAVHCGHHTCDVFRPRTTSNVSVSIVIFVWFAITLALTYPARPLADRASRSNCRGACRGLGRKVLLNGVIISD